MKKFFIGIITALMFAFNTVPAEAVVPQKRVATSVVHFIGKACDNAANVLWRNKGAVAVGTTAVAVATNPEPFVQGATAVVTGTTQTAIQSGTGGGFFSFLLLATLFIAGLWLFVGCIRRKFWRIVPLLVIGVLICLCGVTEAATLHSAAVPVAAAIKPLVNAIGWVVIIAATIFL